MLNNNAVFLIRTNSFNAHYLYHFCRLCKSKYKKEAKKIRIDNYIKNKYRNNSSRHWLSNALNDKTNE